MAAPLGESEIIAVRNKYVLYTYIFIMVKVRRAVEKKSYFQRPVKKIFLCYMME